VKYRVTVVVEVEAVSSDAAINLAEDALASYKIVDFDLVESEAEDA
jgi:hypothetical protein